MLGALSPASAQPRVISAEAKSGVVANPEHAIDGDPATAFTFEWGNGGASITLDLGEARVVTAVRITSAETDRLVWLREVSAGPDPEHLRPLLGRPVNQIGRAHV